MSPLTPSERSQRARAASFASWAKTHDPKARTDPGRRAFDERFLDEVDKDRVLPEAERLRRAAAARKAHFARLALRSAVVRRQRSGKTAPEPSRPVSTEPLQMETEEIRKDVEAGICPWCKRGPFTVLATHTAQVHGVDRLALRKLLGVHPEASITTPDYQAKRSAISTAIQRRRAESAA